MKLLKISEVAEILNVTLDRAYALARSGSIPVVYIGRQVRVEKEKLLEWIRGGGKKIIDTSN
ncbi:helix-turn-helix domain-containing protein [Bacillus pinisoli]|uniref:helix-turn-helix domain-containing protein n=1 Tax=Bacillus pinisoli TaxID=2901866 RepID=UPI001FF28737|nr:helix-turn-helix domain-containing protein [Bacillus pinisoli]